MKTLSNQNQLYQQSLFLTEDPDRAAFSTCRSYRYTLWRKWRTGARYVMFIGLNPSTADEFNNDPTLRRCINFAKNWNYDAMCMTNLFAFRATDPAVMKSAREPIGIENDEWLLKIAQNAGIIIAAWGNHGSFLERDAQVKNLIKRSFYCLGISKAGFPLHPLYQPASAQPVPFK